MERPSAVGFRCSPRLLAGPLSCPIGFHASMKSFRGGGRAGPRRRDGGRGVVRNAARAGMVAGRSAWPEDGRGRRRRLRARRRHGVPGLRARAGRRARCRSAACRGRGSALSGSMRRARSSSGGACHDWRRRMMLRLVLWVLFRAVRRALSERRQLRVNRPGLQHRPTGFGNPRHDLTDMLEMTEADAGLTVYAPGAGMPSRKAAPCRNQVVDVLRTGVARADPRMQQSRVPWAPATLHGPGSGRGRG